MGLGDTYYINTETGETSTEVPDDYEEDEEEDVSSAPTTTWVTREEYGQTFMSNPATGEEFQVMADDTNQQYYLNLKTGNSQWNDPSEEQEDTVEVDYTDTAPSLFEEEEQLPPEPEEDPMDEINDLFKELQMGLQKNLDTGIGDGLAKASNVDLAFTQLVETKADNLDLCLDEVAAMKEDLRDAVREGDQITAEDEIVMDDVEHHNSGIIRRDSIGMRQQEMVQKLQAQMAAGGTSFNF